MTALTVLLGLFMLTVAFPRALVLIGLGLVIFTYIAALPAFVILMVWALARAVSG